MALTPEQDIELDAFLRQAYASFSNLVKTWNQNDYPELNEFMPSVSGILCLHSRGEDGGLLNLLNGAGEPYYSHAYNDPRNRITITNARQELYRRIADRVP